MLTAIELKDMPLKVRGRERSPMSIFAEQTVTEFLEGFTELGQIAEVTGWPMNDERDDIWNANKAADTLRSVLFYRDREKDYRDDVKVSRSGSRVFMRRIKVIKPKPNPYPGDSPRMLKPAI